MAGPAVETLLFLLDEAFESNEEHSLMVNLRSVPPADWWTAPSGGERSIAAIAGHVGWCHFMYDDYAFGRGSLTGDDPLVEPPFLREPAEGNVEALFAWLRAGFDRFRASVAALKDSDLATLRGTTWGEPAETRWIISVIIEHALYHAGEINHIRSLLSGNDRWAFADD